tara:strand:+ start:578 stop:1102 length:525 start_codon:yes stop_codon:yes gene_type:complete
MKNYIKKGYQLIHILIINLCLISCISTSGSIKPYQNNYVDITNNFSLEGKFKLSMKDSKETGYFFLEKKRNLVKFNIGKSYLLPEKELLLDIREDLDLNKLISETDQDALNLKFSVLKVSDFIQIIIGKQSDLSAYADLEVFKEFKNENEFLPSKISLKTSNYELIIFNKKIYE